jgi:hypothetical protein
MLISMASGAMVHADDSGARRTWSLRGFGSAGPAYSDFTGGSYNWSPLKASGVGCSDQPSAEVDSRLGAQPAVKAGKQWPAILQVASEQRIDGSYKPVVEWANIKYEICAEVSLRFVKLQFDRITPLGGSRGTFVNVQPGFLSGRSVNVAGTVLDFVG